MYSQILYKSKKTKKGSNEKSAIDKNRVTITGIFSRGRATAGRWRDTCNSLFKSRKSDRGFSIRCSNVHASGDIHNMLVGLLDVRIVLHKKLHSLVVDFMTQDNVTRILESAVSTHLDKVFVGLIDSFSSDTW